MTQRTREKTAAVACTVSGTRYTLYECPAQCRALVRFINVASAAASNLTSIELYKAATTSRFNLIWQKSLNSGDTYTLQEAYLTLEAGDRIEVTATGASVDVDGICTVEEILRPVG